MGWSIYPDKTNATTRTAEVKEGIKYSFTTPFRMSNPMEEYIRKQEVARKENNEQ